MCWACPKAATVAAQRKRNDCVLKHQYLDYEKHDDLNRHSKQYADAIISGELEEFWQSYMGVWTGKYPEMVLDVRTSGVVLWSASIHALQEYLEAQFDARSGSALKHALNIPQHPVVFIPCPYLHDLSAHVLRSPTPSDDSRAYDSCVSESESAVDGQDLDKQDYTPPLSERSGCHSYGESEDGQHDAPHEDVHERVLLWRDAVIALADKVNVFSAADLASDSSSLG